MPIISTRATGRKVYYTSLISTPNHKYCYQGGKRELKKLLFRNEIIIYKKEYDIRLVASLQTK